MNIIALNKVFQYADGHLGVHLLDSEVAEFTSVKNVEDALKIIRENKVVSVYRTHSTNSKCACVLIGVPYN